MSTQQTEQILVGKLLNPSQIEVKGKLIDIDGIYHRAKWSWLRLQYGRDIDMTIKMLYEEKKVRSKAQAKQVLSQYFKEKMENINPERSREMQFIVSPSDTVLAVASLKHLLIPPSSVYAVANQILKASGHQLLVEDDIAGQIAYLPKEELGIKRGLQIYGGSINTRFAIRVSVIFKVMRCLNVVSWLGIGNFGQWLPDANKNYERVLRIKVLTELEPRLVSAISSAQQSLSKLDEQIELAKKIHLTKKAAKALAASMGFSYGLGAETVKQVLDEFASEQQTLYGLSMAESYIARHGTFSDLAKEVTQKLSTIAGATILIKHPKDAEKKSIAWLKAHIKKGQLKNLDDIVGDLI